MKKNAFDIVVSFRTKDNALLFYRLYENGDKVFLTSTDITKIHAVNTPAQFEEFAKTLGENILLFLPEATAVLGL